MSKKGGKKNQQPNRRGQNNKNNSLIPENNNKNKNNNNYNNNNKNSNKINERQTRQRYRKEKNRKQYGDAEWKREFDLFLDQLKLIGLTIKDVAGDGNCLFRAIADQMEGNPNKHPTYRKRICEFIDANRDDYEPFLEDDELWEEYMPRMKANGTWGGQMEIQAFSLAYSVNITIHQLGQPRWDIVNFHGMKSIHLSYHQGEHYSSVRKIGDVNHLPEAPKEINLFDSKKPPMKPPHEE
jgi:OTU domain-containing protein 3